MSDISFKIKESESVDNNTYNEGLIDLKFKNDSLREENAT